MSSTRVRVVEEQVLSNDWYLLKKTVFDYQRRDGRWQRHRARPTTAATAPCCCCSMPRAARWC